MWYNGICTKERDLCQKIELSVDFLEGFKKLYSLLNPSYDAFLDYMNKNNVWSLSDDLSGLKSMMGCDIVDELYFYGKYLTKDERDIIISKYEDRYSISIERDLYE